METLQQTNRTSRIIYSPEDARELTPEEKLSPLDLAIYDRVIEKADLLPKDRKEDYLDYQIVIDAINEDCCIGSKRFLDTVRWLNDRFPIELILLIMGPKLAF